MYSRVTVCIHVYMHTCVHINIYTHTDMRFSLSKNIFSFHKQFGTCGFVVVGLFFCFQIK